MKQVIIAVLVVVGIIGGAVIFGKDDEVVGATSSHIYGKADSSVLVQEIADFECPACAFYFPIFEEVKEKYKDQAGFQFMHFPLVQSHRNALAAHRAGEAAGKQDKFWEMYDLLFTNQEVWNGPSQTDPVGIPTEQAIQIFEQYATNLGLDVAKFKTDVSAPETLATINADTAEAKSKFSVTGTPTFVINGKVITDTSTIDTVEEFSALIEEALGINQGAEVDQSKDTETTTTE